MIVFNMIAMVGVFALVVCVSVFAAFVGHCFHPLPPFRLSSVSRSAIHSLSLPSSSSFSHPAPRLIGFIALLAQVVFARLLIVALFRVFCTLIAVSNRCLAVAVLSYRSLSISIRRPVLPWIASMPSLALDCCS